MFSTSMQSRRTSLSQRFYPTCRGFHPSGGRTVHLFPRSQQKGARRELDPTGHLGRIRPAPPHGRRRLTQLPPPPPQPPPPPPQLLPPPQEWPPECPPESPPPLSPAHQLPPPPPSLPEPRRPARPDDGFFRPLDVRATNPTTTITRNTMKNTNPIDLTSFCPPKRGPRFSTDRGIPTPRRDQSGLEQLQSFGTGWRP